MGARVSRLARGAGGLRLAHRGRRVELAGCVWRADLACLGWRLSWRVRCRVSFARRRRIFR
jgi:hypothetical protein